MSKSTGSRPYDILSLWGYKRNCFSFKCSISKKFATQLHGIWLVNYSVKKKNKTSYIFKHLQSGIILSCSILIAIWPLVAQIKTTSKKPLKWCVISNIPINSPNLHFQWINKIHSWKHYNCKKNFFSKLQIQLIIPTAKTYKIKTRQKSTYRRSLFEIVLNWCTD